MDNNVNDKSRNRLGSSTMCLKCLQINLQHSRLSTDNLLKILEEEDTDIVCIQEPYNIGDKIVGIPRSHTVLTSGEGKKLEAIVINNKHIDVYRPAMLGQLPTCRLLISGRATNTTPDDLQLTC